MRFVVFEIGNNKLIKNYLFFFILIYKFISYNLNYIENLKKYIVLLVI